MQPMTFNYPSTAIWNCQCDQDADPGELVSTLANRDVSFALGFNVLFEIAKLFFRGKDNTERGRELFAYMNRYRALRVQIVKENWALLVEEALDVTENKRMECWIRNDCQYQQTIQEIDKLCRGETTPEAARFFKGRKAEAQPSTTMIANHLEIQPDFKESLDRISDETLPSLLESACTGPAVRSLLTGHVLTEFSDESPPY